MKDCEKCRNLRQEYKVTLPYELKKVIRVIKDNLADGTIVEKAKGGERSFTEIKEEGPWVDIVDYSFKCSECNREFRFVAETYHGSGGKWYEERSDD